MKIEVLRVGGGSMLLEGVKSLQVKLEDGSWLGIHPGHARLIAATADGELRFHREAEEERVSVSEGILTVDHDRITILTTH